MPTRKESVRVQIRPSDVAYWGKFLLISSRLSRNYLDEIYIKIQTHLEGEKFLSLKNIYEKTDVVPDKGKKYHFFQVVEKTPFIGAKKIEFFRINEKHGGVIGKEISI